MYSITLLLIALCTVVEVLSGLMINCISDFFPCIMKAREEEMTAKVHELQAQLEGLQKEYKQRMAEEERWNSEKVSWH